MQLLAPGGRVRVEATPYDFVRGAFKLRGRPIDLSHRPWLPQIYNLEVTKNWLPGRSCVRKSVMIFGRQCEKSTSVGNKLLAAAAMTPFLRCLYVNPSGIQVREFSDERLKTPVEESELLRWMTRTPRGSTIPQNVNTKWFANQAKINLRSCYLTADRIRGLAVDDLTVDEIQDILVENLPVIEETTFHSEVPWGPTFRYIGTPKGFDTPLEHYWANQSTQCEWMVRCSACNHWNVIEHDCFGPDGLECIRCRGPIDPVNDTAQWVAQGPIDAPFVGFRLPQPVVIYCYAHEPDVFRRKWAELAQKQKHYKRAQLLNEVWARPYDRGTKPITREQLQRCCNPDWRGARDPGQLERLRLSSTLKWAGIDWGKGLGGGKTCLTIWEYTGRGKLRLAYWKAYVGVESDEDFIITDIVATLKKAGVARVGPDAGFGWGMNSQLVKALQGKVIPICYSGTQKAAVTYEADSGQLVANRTQVMHWVFQLIKREMYELPAWTIFQEDLLPDFMCISQDFRTSGSGVKSEVFYHPPGTQDDFFHTAVYGLIMSMFDVERPDITDPANATGPVGV